MQAEPLLESSTNPSTAVPAYYRAPFHAYREGNLCWAAACEAEQATSAMALRVWPKETLAPAEAEERLRRAIFAAVEPSLSGTVQRVLDLGCSVGVGTQAVKQWLDQRQGTDVVVEGLDLSPQMLAVARARDPESRISQWHHAAAEATGLPDGSFDLVMIQFVCHELPAEATRAMLRETRRLLRPGGVVGLADQDPASEVIRSLPAPLAGRVQKHGALSGGLLPPRSGRRRHGGGVPQPAAGTLRSPPPGAGGGGLKGGQGLLSRRVAGAVVPCVATSANGRQGRRPGWDGFCRERHIHGRFVR